MAKKVTITIELEYDEASISDADRLEYHLHEEVDRAIGSGFVTPTGEEIVESFDISIEVE